MDLVQITDILKNLIKTRFKNESDLKMLINTMELIGKYIFKFIKFI
jgi:hypothetical protein